MTTTPAQEREHRSACNAHAAAARLLLETGELSIVGRNSAGDVEEALVHARDGAPLTRREALERLIEERRRAQARERLATEHLVANLQAMRAAGVDLNLAELARETGIARSTLYHLLESAPAAA